MESIELQTDILANLEYDGKLQQVHKSESHQVEESKKNEGQRKDTVEIPQGFLQNYKAEENEENRKRRTIKVEKFECSDDILPQIGVDYEPEESRENKKNVLVKLEHCCDKLDNVSVSTINCIEESKKNEKHIKIKVDEFNVEATQESIQNYEADEYEGNGKYIIIKVEKFDCSDDILPQISVDCYEPEQNREKKNNVLVKSEHPYDKLSQTSQVFLNQPEKNEENQRNKDSTAIVTSAVYEVSGESNSSVQPSSKKRRRGGNLSEKQNTPKDTISSVLTQDDDSESVNVEASKVLVTDSQCYVALEKLSYKCDICRYVTVIKEMLVSHMKLHNFKQSDSSSECKLQLKKQIISEKYQLKQIYDNPFPCNLCSYKSAYKSHLTEHILTHTGEKPFACNVCPYKSARKSNLNKHILTHTPEKSFACNLCSYKSAKKSSLKKHVLTHIGEKPLACNMCSYKSTKKSHLNEHILTHTGEKPFVCDLCSYKSARKSNLNKHILTHTREKSFACNVCSYKSDYKSSFNRHILTHTGEKPFACDVCSYKSDYKSRLNRHKLSHTGDKPFACNVCSYKSVYKSHLNIHIYKHTGEKPFACNLCSYKSVYTSSLNKHILTHTREKSSSSSF